jgi:hypothetical protein
MKIEGIIELRHPANNDRVVSFTFLAKELLMQSIRKFNLLVKLFLTLLVLFVTSTTAVLAKGNSEILPQNAHYKTYGDGWECNYGYKQDNDVCTAIKVPANAYLNSYGSKWECKRGYLESGGECSAINVPDNAYLNSYGNKWECKRGYRASSYACLAIKVPANGYLIESSYGSGWKCEHGFRAVGGACMAVRVPVKAHINASGNDWECNMPYRRSNNECISH